MNFVFIKKKGQNKAKTKILGEQLHEHQQEGSNFQDFIAFEEEELIALMEGLMKINNPISMMEPNNLTNYISIRMIKLDIDDMLSLRNFYVNIITFWSSQCDLSSKKSKKTEEKGKDKIVARLVKNVTRFDKTECIVSTLRKTCHDGKNVTRFGETLIQFLVTQVKTCHDLLKT